MNDNHLIDSLEALSKHYGSPSPSSRSKQRDHLTDAMQQWLMHSPFFVLCSHAADGIDASPRGDQPGQAFRILNPHTIAIPDRRGNNRIETLGNVLSDPRVGLVFMIPGVEQALRVKGQARISIDPELLTEFELDGIRPATVMLIEVSSAYIQNARAVRSARLWDRQTAESPATLPDVKSLTGQSTNQP